MIKLFCLFVFSFLLAPLAALAQTEPADLVAGISEVIQLIGDKAPWYAVAVVVIYVVVAVVLGKDKFKIPWVSDKLAALTKPVRTLIAIGLYGLSGALAAIPLGTEAILNGIIVGLLAGLTAAGVKKVGQGLADKES